MPPMDYGIVSEYLQTGGRTADPLRLLVTCTPRLGVSADPSYRALNEEFFVVPGFVRGVAALPV